MSERPDALSAQSNDALDHMLGRLPTPQMPAGLAGRIVRDVTRLPQVTAEEDVAPAPVLAEDRSNVVPLSSPRSRHRWIAWTGGGAATALAASLATLMLLPETTQHQAAPATPDTAVTTTASRGTASVTTAPSAAQDSPKLAETGPATTTRQPSATGPASRAAPSTSAPSQVEVAETGHAETPQAAPPAAPTDSITAEDEAELVDGGNLAVPDVTGQVAPSPGWGYAPGTNAPTVRQSEDGVDDMGGAGGAMDGGMGGRRHRGPSPGRF